MQIWGGGGSVSGGESQKLRGVEYDTWRLGENFQDVIGSTAVDNSRKNVCSIGEKIYFSLYGGGQNILEYNIIDNSYRILPINNNTLNFLYSYDNKLWIGSGSTIRCYDPITDTLLETISSAVSTEPNFFYNGILYQIKSFNKKIRFYNLLTKAWTESSENIYELSHSSNPFPYQGQIYFFTEYKSPNFCCYNIENNSWSALTPYDYNISQAIQNENKIYAISKGNKFLYSYDLISGVSTIEGSLPQSLHDTWDKEILLYIYNNTLFYFPSDLNNFVWAYNLTSKKWRKCAPSPYEEGHYIGLTFNSGRFYLRPTGENIIHIYTALAFD